MDRRKALLGSLVAASLLAAAGYAAALSCPKTLAEEAELELIEVTVDGKVVPAPTGYGLAPTTVWRRFDGTVRLDVQQGGDWYWQEEYVP